MPTILLKYNVPSLSVRIISPYPNPCLTPQNQAIHLPRKAVDPAKPSLFSDLPRSLSLHQVKVLPLPELSLDRMLLLLDLLPRIKPPVNSHFSE